MASFSFKFNKLMQCVGPLKKIICISRILKNKRHQYKVEKSRIQKRINLTIQNIFMLKLIHKEIDNR